VAVFFVCSESVRGYETMCKACVRIIWKHSIYRSVACIVILDWWGERSITSCSLLLTMTLKATHSFNQAWYCYTQHIQLCTALIMHVITIHGFNHASYHHTALIMHAIVTGCFNHAGYSYTRLILLHTSLMMHAIWYTTNTSRNNFIFIL